MLIEYTEIPEDADEEEKEKYYPRYPTDKEYAKVEYKYDFFRRIILRVRPLRLFGKRRVPLSQLLHLMLVTKVYA